MKFESVLSKVQDIREYINMLLGEIDAGPHGNNPNSNAAIEAMLSQVVREVAGKVVDERISRHIFSTGKK